MSDQESIFLQEILTAPDDEAPRRIYADYLEELGDPRGEYIRLQCDRAALPIHHPEQFQCVRRQQELVAEYGEKRLGGALPEELQELSQQRPFGKIRVVRTWRGFVDKISTSPRMFRDHALRFFELIPLRGLAVEEPAGLLRSGHTQRLRELEIKAAGESLPRIAGSSLFQNLRVLRIKTSNVDMDDMESLTESPHLSGLEEFEASLISTGDMCASMLAYPRTLTSLKQIRMNYCQLSPVAVQTLLGSDQLTLERLDIAGNGLGPSSLGSITNAANFARIEQLDLGNNELQDYGVQLFADALAGAAPGEVCRLTRLHLQCNQLTDATSRVLAQADWLKQLELLDLRYNQITIDGIRILAQAQQHFEQPALVLLDRNKVSPAELEELRDVYGPYYRRDMDLI